MNTQTLSHSRFATYTMAVVLAACSIAFELLLAQTVSTLAANTVRWYSLTIGFFLISMGFGAFVYSVLPKDFNRYVLLFWVEIALIIVGCLVVALVHFGHMIFGYLYLRGYDPSSIAVFLFVPLMVSVVIGILTGIELPALMDCVPDEEKDDGRVVLACDYFGSLIGSVSFPLVLLTYFHLFEIGLVIASLNLAVAYFIFFRFLWGGVARWLFRAAALVLVSIGMFHGALQRDNIQEYFLKKYYYYFTSAETFETLFDPMPEMPDILSVQSPYQRIDFVHDEVGSPTDVFVPLFSKKVQFDEESLQNHILFLNGDFQTNSLHEEIYHEYFAHVPIIASGEVPKEALVLGGGDGYLIRELLKYEGIERITHLDLDRSLIELAKTHPVLSKVNKSSLESPRVTTIFDDGFQFARKSKKKFPAIYIDFPIPVDYNLAKLYSTEFYRFVRGLLTEDGFAVFDASGIGLLTPRDAEGNQEIDPENDWPVYYHTVKAAGFEEIQPFVSTIGYDDQAVLQRAVQIPDIFPSPYDTLPIPRDTKLLLRQATLLNEINEFVYSMQQGFIMMGKKEGRLSGKFWHPEGVTLNLLNELRYRQAFQTKFPRSKKVKWENVNSIMLPRFPTTGFWLPRTPW